ncbi:MAG: hypothetical protein LBR61_09040 [Synergistaceae bacterium]|nr:hypothetical protein [Synergistaceae bacterium]
MPEVISNTSCLIALSNNEIVAGKTKDAAIVQVQTTAASFETRRGL